MSSTTTNLGLLKKDPVTDANDTFNITTMLNDNWEKIDAALNRYGTCSTAAATAAKVVAMAGFILSTGAQVAVKFTGTNTAANPTLNINGTGAKAIRYKGATITASYLAANTVYAFLYDGSYWNLVGDVDTDTTYTLLNITGTLAISKGGTGATSAAAALANLGLDATAEELNYCDGVTANIQTQIDAKIAKASIVTATLSAASWTGTEAPYTYSLTVSGVTTTSEQELLPGSSITAEQLAALQAANIIDGGQVANKITLKAHGEKPAINIPIRVVKRGETIG